MASPNYPVCLPLQFLPARTQLCIAIPEADMIKGTQLGPDRNRWFAINRPVRH